VSLCNFFDKELFLGFLRQACILLRLYARFCEQFNVLCSKQSHWFFYIFMAHLSALPSFFLNLAIPESGSRVFLPTNLYVLCRALTVCYLVILLGVTS